MDDSKQPVLIPPKPLDPEAEMKKISRRSVLWSLVSLCTVYGGIHWLNHNPTRDGIVSPLRSGLEFDESLFKKIPPELKAQEFPVSRAQDVKDNGPFGLSTPVDLATYRILVGGVGLAQPLEFTPDQLRQLPRVEQVTELRCIEGWSRIIHWTGVRFKDFYEILVKPHLTDANADTIAMETPDGEYYVSLDRDSAMHSQTLLAYGMNGHPLPLDHGAPVRLVIPTKYGIKNIKRIGKITFQNGHARDYWGERGYDWYAGL